MAPTDLASFLAGEDPPAEAPPGTGSRFAPREDFGDAPRPGLRRAPDPEAAPSRGRKPEEGADTAPGGGKRHAPTGEPVRVLDRFEIFPDTPYPDLATPLVRAFAARDLRRANSDLFAYVPTGNAPPRLDLVSAIRGFEMPGVMKLVEVAAAELPGDGKTRPILIYERPAGGRLVRDLSAPLRPLGEAQLTRRFIEPVVQALRDLKLRRVFHGAINPTNIFIGSGGDGLQLGDCLATPPGLSQASQFEPIERSMADPAGRGAGTLADDLFATGVTILALAIGRIPAAGMPEAELLDRRIEMGSYAALIGNDRLSPTVMEPIRGLLLDDPAQRWDLDDLDLWLSGRRLSPKQAQPARRAQRGFSFAGGEYHTARQLAAAMARQPTDAAKTIDDGGMVRWIRRSLEDDALVRRIDEAVQTARSTRGGTLEDRILARVLSALDPAAPIRYRGHAVMPEGLGQALAAAAVDGGDPQPVAEMVAAQLPMFWINVQPAFRPEFVPLAKQFDRLRGWLEKKTVGLGLERCLYELNPGLPCQSAMLEGFHVVDLGGLIRALDQIGSQDRPPAGPIDRHIAGFILSRKPGMADRLFLDLDPDRPKPVRARAALEVMLELQVETRQSPLPGLCTWLVRINKPTIAAFHSKTLRERLTEELDRQAQTGLVRNIFALIRNADLEKRDVAGFETARRLWQDYDRRAAQARGLLDQREAFEKTIGRRVAAVTASMAASALFAGILIMGLT